MSKPENYGTTDEHKTEHPSGTTTAVPQPTAATAAATSSDNALTSSSKFTCFKYGMFLLCGFLLCLALRNNTVQFLSKLPGLSSGCSDNRCFGTQGVYRVSFSLLLFYLVHFLMSSSYNLCMEPSTRVAFNTLGMKWKVPVFILTLILSFVLPNGFFVGYGWWSVVASCFFLIAQVLVLIDFAYAWNEEWTTKAEESDQSSNKWAWGLLICSVTMFGLSFTLLGFCYKWFPCDLGKTFTSLTIILNVFATVVSLRVPHGSIVPSSMVFMYNALLAFTAMTTINPSSCNNLMTGSTDGSQWWIIVINSVVSAVSITYAAASSAHSRGTFSLEEGLDGGAADGEDACSPYTYFHGMMILASSYLAMLMSSWDVTGTGSSSAVGDETSMWVKMVCSWVTILLYMWSLVAPVIFPDRFSSIY